MAEGSVRCLLLPRLVPRVVPVLVPALALALCTAGCFQNYWANRRRDLHESFLYDAQLGVGLNTDVRVGPLAWGIGLGSRSVAALGKVNWWTEPTAFHEINISFLGGAVLSLFGQLPDMPGRVALAMASQAVLKEVTAPDSTLEGLVYERMSLLGVGNLIQLGRREQTDDPRQRSFVDASLGDRSVGDGSFGDRSDALPPASAASPPAPKRRRSGLTTKHKIIDQFGLELGAFGGVVGTRVGFNPLEFADFLLGFLGLDLLFDDS